MNKLYYCLKFDRSKLTSDEYLNAIKLLNEDKFKNFKLSPSAVKVGHFFKRRRSSEFGRERRERRRSARSVPFDRSENRCQHSQDSFRERAGEKRFSVFPPDVATSRRLAASLLREKVKDGR